MGLIEALRVVRLRNPAEDPDYEYFNATDVSDAADSESGAVSAVPAMNVRSSAKAIWALAIFGGPVLFAPEMEATLKVCTLIPYHALNCMATTIISRQSLGRIWCLALSILRKGALETIDGKICVHVSFHAFDAINFIFLAWALLGRPSLASRVWAEYPSTHDQRL